jgi:RimJ/RimL family protein N-acetyltransferase
MLNHKGTQTIETERLTLRSLELQDSKSLFENGCLGSTEEETENIVGNMIKYYVDKDNYNWGIEYNGEVIGRVKVIEISSRDSYVQLAYDIGESYRNKGLMTEAIKGIISFLFNDVGVHRIYGQCRTNNIASVKVMLKAGMIFEGRQRKHYIESDGTYCDVDIYAIIIDDLFSDINDFIFLDTENLTDGEIELVCIEKKPANSEMNYLPAYCFDIIKDNKRVGEINLRIGFNENIYYGGHIGYSVDEAYRCNGYASRACELIKPLVIKHSLKHLLITNNPENTASRRVCEKIGANLIRIVDLPEQNEMYLEGERRKCIYQWDLEFLT